MNIAAASRVELVTSTLKPEPVSRMTFARRLENMGIYHESDNALYGSPGLQESYLAKFSPQA